MAVIGVDIGDYNTYISVAKAGGVETIANEYSQRNTPSIVALGDKQRFMGVSAENQRNINVKNTVSFFKNFLGRSFKDPYVQKHLGNVGAEVVELTDGKIGFNLGGKTFLPEQILGMMLTKVKEIVKTEQNEDIETCVISVPLNFTQTQRGAVLDSASLAGISSVQIINDTSALALAYGKTKSDLPEAASSARLVVFVDVGCGGLQSCLAAVSKDGASLLASSTSTNTGGKLLDSALLDFTVAEIEAKYGCEVRNNRKAVNKLRLAVEKIKKQMSANSTKLPLQIENLCEDLDVNLSIDRVKFEELIQSDLAEVRRTLSILLDSTTVKKDQIDSVELVGGSSRIPAVRQIIQDLFGLQ
jgi:molecular chaperone DnaK (HSP70)